MGQYIIENVDLKSNAMVIPFETNGKELIVPELKQLNVYFNRETWIIGDYSEEYNDLQAVYREICEITRQFYRKSFRDNNVTVDDISFDLLSTWEEFTISFRLDDNSNLIIN